MFRYVIYAILIGIVLINRFALPPIQKKIEERTLRKHPNSVLQPILCLYSGILLIVIGGAMILFLSLLPKEKITGVDPLAGKISLICISGVFFLFGAFMLILRLNWRVDVSEEGFTFRNVFRITKKYSFNEIREVCDRMLIKYYSMVEESTTDALYTKVKGRGRILTISTLYQNSELLTNAFAEWRKRNGKDDEGRIKAATALQKKVLKGLRKGGLDKLPEDLRRKVWETALLEKSRPIRDFFTIEEFIRIANTMVLTLDFECGETRFTIQHYEKDDRVFFGIIPSGADADTPITLEDYSSAGDLLYNAYIDGKPLYALWNEITFLA